MRTSINAGLDMIMVPTQYTVFEQTLKVEVAAGRVKQSRVDDAVAREVLARPLRAAECRPHPSGRGRLGLAPGGGTRGHGEVAGAAEEHRLAAAAGARRQGLRGRGNADDLGNQSGGWSISWQGSSGQITQGTTILQGIREVAPDAAVTFSRDASAPLEGHDVGVVVVGETPYAEGVGDVGVNGRALSLPLPTGPPSTRSAPRSDASCSSCPAGRCC